MLSDKVEVKTDFHFENAEEAKNVMKDVAEECGYRYQEMNSIAVAYKHGKEAIVKYDDRLEVYIQEAEDKIEKAKEEN